MFRSRNTANGYWKGGLGTTTRYATRFLETALKAGDEWGSPLAGHAMQMTDSDLAHRLIARGKALAHAIEGLGTTEPSGPFEWASGIGES